MDASTNLHNYANPSANLVVAVLLPTLGTLAVSARFSLQIAKKVTLSADDWLCLLALLFVWACGAAAILGVSQNSLGHHTILNAAGMTATNDPSYAVQMTVSHKLVFVFNILAYPALCFTKLSILFFYRRIFRGMIFNFMAWFFIGFVICWTLLYDLIWIFSCGIHFGFWWGTIQQVHDLCLNIFDEMIVGTAIDFILDFAILFLPAVKIWQLQMPIRQRIMVLGVFLTGLLSTIAGVLRFLATLALADFGLMGFQILEHRLSLDIQLDKNTKTLGVSGTDWMGMVTIHIFWTMIEVGVALIAVCLPLFRPGALLHQGFRAQRWFGTLSKRSHSRSPTHSLHPSYPSHLSNARPVSDLAASEKGVLTLSKIGPGFGDKSAHGDYRNGVAVIQDNDSAEWDFKV